MSAVFQRQAMRGAWPCHKPSSTGLYPVHLVHRMLVVADASATTMPISGSLYDFEMSPEKGKKDLGDNGRRDRNLMKKEGVCE